MIQEKKLSYCLIMCGGDQCKHYLTLITLLSKEGSGECTHVLCLCCSHRQSIDAWVKVQNFENPESRNSDLKTCIMPIKY